jgi:hypothetical protein
MFYYYSIPSSATARESIERGIAAKMIRFAVIDNYSKGATKNADNHRLYPSGAQFVCPK